MDVLQGLVLGPGAALDAELWVEAEGLGDEGLLGEINVVNIEIDVVRTDLGGQVLGALAGLFGALLRHAHVDGMEDLVAKLLRGLGQGGGVAGEAADAVDDRLVASLASIDGETTHGKDHDSSGARVDAAGQGDEVAGLGGACEIVPEVATGGEGNLLLRKEDGRLKDRTGAAGGVEVVRVGAEGKGSLDTNKVSVGLGRLEAARGRSAVGTDFLEIDGCSDDLDVEEAELRSLGDDIAWRVLVGILLLTKHK